MRSLSFQMFGFSWCLYIGVAFSPAWAANEVLEETLPASSFQTPTSFYALNVAKTDDPTKDISPNPALRGSSSSVSHVKEEHMAVEDKLHEALQRYEGADESNKETHAAEIQELLNNSRRNLKGKSNPTHVPYDDIKAITDQYDTGEEHLDKYFGNHPLSKAEPFRRFIHEGGDGSASVHPSLKKPLQINFPQEGSERRPAQKNHLLSRAQDNVRSRSPLSTQHLVSIKRGHLIIPPIRKHG